ncbi:MAG: reprolysin-like metallopeptidase, partial [Planctomycetota bacterium]
TSNGSFILEEDGSLTAIEGGDRFDIYTLGNYEIQDDGTLVVSPDSGDTLTYAADAFHVHNDGTVHVRVSAHGEKSGGGCPGCGGVGCGSCGPPQSAAVIDSQTDVDVSAFVPDAGLPKGDLGGQDDDTGATGRRTGETLRTYRLANATTVEYSNFHGGTQAGSLAAVVTSINRVTGITEVELTIRLELVPNNDDLIFTSDTGDSYSNGNLGAMLGQNQSVVDSVVGNANYDIGHVFGTGGGGVAAGLGIVGITGIKAQGVSTSSVPTGVGFDGLVAHEMGHQFGAAHTWNGAAGNCSAGQHSSNSSYEPGSGSTIQAYAGICGADNIQSTRDLYWHSRSLDQILAHVDNRIPGVGTRTSTGNSEPVADAGPNYEIPAGTPFMLTGTGTDPDGDTLTYVWEQRDLGSRQPWNSPDDGSSALVRSRLDSVPTRVFPSEQNLVAGNYQSRGDRLPTVPRRMDFRLTVRDNASGGGGLDTDNMWVDINDTGAPFEVTSQASGGGWLGGETETITWNVANTDLAPINTTEVDILISTDGGFTYDIELATGVPNNGSYSFTVPTTIGETAEARVMVKSVGNIFFDINDQNFTIIDEDTTAPTAEATVSDVTNSGSSSVFIPVVYTDNQSVDVSDIGPGNLGVVAPDGTVLPVDYISQSSMTDTTPVTGNYRLFAPAGGWDVADNGTYTVRLFAGQVSDVSGNVAIADADIGTFDVALPFPAGDFNENGLLDCADIDLMTTTIADGINDPSLDLTGEGVLNYADVLVWIEDLKGTFVGDANLDLVVDGSDFIQWNAHKFTSGTAWCSGDFNADGTTDGTDFLLWNNNKFQAADGAGTLIAPLQASTQPIQREEGPLESVGRPQASQPQAAPAVIIPVQQRQASQATLYVPQADANDVDDDARGEERWSSRVDAYLESLPA